MAAITVTTVGSLVGITLIGNVTHVAFNPTSLASAANMTMYTTIYTSYPLLGIVIAILIAAIILLFVAAKRSI